MITLNLQKGNVEHILVQLKEAFGGEIQKDFKENSLRFNNSDISGSVRSSKLKGGLSFLQFNLQTNIDVSINFYNKRSHYLYFAYCSEGKLCYNIDSKSDNILETYQTGILYNSMNNMNTLTFRKGESVSTHIISVNISDGFVDNFKINNQLKKKFIQESNKNLVYIGSPNLKIADNIRQIKAITQIGMVKSLLIEGLVHMILAQEIEQHRYDLSKTEQNLGSLSHYEMSKIQEMTTFINEHPETPMTVTEMSRKVGLTPSKLQEGFKLMHNRTVNDYIRHTRIVKSEELIKTTDMNLSQILYTLGFSSRSYFSKIFKKKYKCSPSHYRAKIKLAATA